MIQKPFAAATDRNSSAILDVLRQEFSNVLTVLEIGSGTGQHAVYFGRQLEHLEWQTSDLADNHEDISAWVDDAGLENVHPPLELDVRTAQPTIDGYDGVFSANTAHIMAEDAVEDLFGLVADILHNGGIFILYGPFRQAGRFNTLSNENFHESLQQRNPAMGIRDLDDLDAYAARGHLARVRLYAMPANNHMAVWIKD
jgi:cyclopropane fatty-acyl-phospholipid synthase-like methyltransferase